MAAGAGKISRVMRTKEEARITYDRISGWYDLLEGRWEKESKEEGLRMLGVREGERVLEIGFGTGHCIVGLARSAGASGKVYGVDLSPRMLEITSRKVKEAGLSNRVELQCGDAASLPFERNFLDAVFMSYVLELFDTPEIPVLLSECTRVLREGARIVVVSLSKKGRPALMRTLYEFGHRSFPKLFDCRPIYVCEALEDAGFEIGKKRTRAVFGLPVELVLARKKG